MMDSSVYSLPGLSTETLGRVCLIFEELPSTNTFLKENAADLSHGAAVIARRQTAGRGRLGRAWAPAGDTSLAMSLLLKDIAIESLEILPLLCAVAVVRALEGMTGIQVGIKWPNDLIADGGKLCGILCESRILGETCCAVCGMGVNLGQSAEAFQRMDLPYAVSLAMMGAEIHPLDAAAAILNHLEVVLQENGTGELCPEILQEYVRKSATVGREVRVTLDGEIREGFAEGITPKGELLFTSGGGTARIRSGEASVRGLWGYV